MRPGLPRFSRSSASVYYTERKPKNKKRGRPGSEATYVVYTYSCSHDSSLPLTPDSGKGASSEAGSRPNSQVINYSIDESNVRTVRSENNIRKQSNQSDQGVVTDETTSPKALPRNQTVVEGRERDTTQ